MTVAIEVHSMLRITILITKHIGMLKIEGYEKEKGEKKRKDIVDLKFYSISSLFLSFYI